MLEVISGYDAKDPASANIAVPDFHCASECRARVGSMKTWESIGKPKQPSIKRSKF
jgi:hypothetical protein